MNDEKIIKSSRTTMSWSVVLGCLFVAAGYWMYQTDAYQLSKMRHHDGLLSTHAFGILLMAGGTAVALFCIRAIFNNKPGLILNSHGIVIHPELATDQLIPWDDIIGVEVVEYRNDTRLAIMLKNPEKYIEIGGVVERKLRRNESMQFGSPITITTMFLDIDLDRLKNLCKSYLVNYGN